MVKPLLVDVPERIETPRLILQMPKAGYGKEVHGAVTLLMKEQALTCVKKEELADRFLIYAMYIPSIGGLRSLLALQ